MRKEGEPSQEQSRIEIKQWSHRTRKPAIKSRYFLLLLMGMLICYFLIFFPSPYYAFQPGSAEELKPMVKVNQGYAEESGTLMLTTVSVSSNPLSYVMAFIARLNPNADLVNKDTLFRSGESKQEYFERQDFIMLASQSNAILAAYHQLNIPYHIKNEGVIILQTLEGMPADSVLQVGDRVLKMDGTEINIRQDLLDFVAGKQIGDTVQITFQRGDKEQAGTITLGDLSTFKAEKGNAGTLQPRAGLGVVPADIQSIQAEQSGQQVQIDAGEIGGPSAGLMFSLEIYNQLVQEDITKGYRIAGTGEIDPEGNVGVIGGIQHKIVAADKVGADIFFAPKDYYPSDKSYQPIKNTTDAIRQAKNIGSKMRVISVATMEDALKFLDGLEPRG